MNTTPNVYIILMWLVERASNDDQKAKEYINSLFKQDVIDSVIGWMSELAEKGEVNTQYNLALHYRQTTDDKEALKWFTKAAESECVPACWYLGLGYQYGIWGVDKNIDEAIKSYTKVANSDEDYAVDAELRIKSLNKNGE